MHKSGLAVAFSRADAAFSAALRGALREAQLQGVVDPGMGPVLFALEDRGVLTMSELAEVASIPRSTMTGISARMAERGLVRTAPNPQDGRGIVAALTPRGKTVVARLRAVERALDEAMRRAVPPGDANRLIEMLDSLARAFSTS